MNREEITKKIGANIKKYRLAADVSQENLSLAAKLSSSYLGKLERGEKCPTIDTLYKISEALKISVCDLIIFNNSELHTDSELFRRMKSAFEKASENKKIIIVEMMENIVKMDE